MLRSDRRHGAVGASKGSIVSTQSSAEALEDRRLFATFTVTTLDPDGPGSLVDAVRQANAAPDADVINFQPGLSGNLEVYDTVRVTESLDIQGPGADVINVMAVDVHAEGNVRVLHVQGTADTTISVRVAGLTISRARHDSQGGAGILNGGEDLLLERMVVTNNRSYGGPGGGVYNGAGTLTIRDSTISNNHSDNHRGGGGIHSNGGTLRVERSTIAGNSAFAEGLGGGGISITAATTAVIDNSTISGNTQSGYGGGISSAGDLTIRNSTIAFNRADTGVGGEAAGGGVYVEGGTTRLQSTIVANNDAAPFDAQPGDGDVARESGATVIAASSVIEQAPPGTFLESDSNWQSYDPKLAPLADNGGPTKTHALLPGSRAIDAGYDAAGGATEQRGTGFARNVRGTDVGAYEFQSSRQIVDDVIDAHVQDGSAARTNFGTAAKLLVKKSSSTGTNRIAYLRFDLSYLDPVDQIGAAKIVLVGQLHKEQAGGVPLSLAAVSNTTWSEPGITWNNKPSVGTTLATHTLTSTSPTRVEFDVTDYLRQQKAAGKNLVSFAIRGTKNTSAIAQFASDETAGGGYPVMMIDGQEANRPVPAPLAPTHDTYVRNGTYAFQTYGSEPELLVKRGSSDGAVRDAYLKFNLADFPEDGTATLRLFGRISDTRAASLGVTLHRAIGSGWTEDTLTWDDYGPRTGDAIGAKTITGTAGRWYEWNVTDYVRQTKAAGNADVTFIVTGNANSSPWVIFNSSEAASDGPQLVIGV